MPRRAAGKRAPQRQRRAEGYVWLAAAAMFLDGAAAAGALPILSLVGARVALPSWRALAVFQLLHLVPQVASTWAAERAGAAAGGRLALAVCCAAAACALYVEAVAVERGSLAWFLAYRALGGVTRHERVCAALLPEVRSAAGALFPLWSAVAGVVVVGAAADRVGDAAALVRLLAAAELAAAALAVCYYMAGLRSSAARTDASGARAAAYASYVRWAWRLFTGRMGAGAFAAPLCTFVALLVAASVHQCRYPMVFRAYGLSFSAGGCHLAAQVVLGAVAAPRAVDWCGARLRRARGALLAALAAGAAVVPTVGAAPALRWRYYAAATALVDVPAALLLAQVAQELAAALPVPAGCGAYGRELPRHVTVTAKLLSPALLGWAHGPLRSCAAPPGAVLSLPPLLYLLVREVTGSAAAAAAAAVAAASVLLTR